MKFHVMTALSGEEALNILATRPVDVIITDQRMPNMTGIAFLERVLERYPEPMRLLLTGYADMNAVIEAVNKGKIYYYLAKPWNEDEITKTIEQAYEVYLENKKVKDMNSQLAISNDQLEFMLRQKLIS